MQVALEKSEGELWAELNDCFREVRSCAYAFRYTFVEPNGKTQGENARIRVNEIYNGLSPELKEYLRSTKVLIEISRFTDEQLAYEKGRFARTLPQIRERAKTLSQMPSNLTGLLQGLAVHFIEEKTGN